MKRKSYRLYVLSFALTAALCTGSVIYAADTETPETGSHSLSEYLPDGMKQSPARAKSRGAAALPASYDPRNSAPWLTDVKDQYDTGCCWAFSSLDCAAMSSIKSGEQPADFSLSVWQLAYFNYNRINDPLGLTEGDTNTTANRDVVSCGGNALLTSMTLAQGISPAEDTLAPFPDLLKAWNKGKGNVTLSNEKAYQGYRLSESSTLQATDIQGIKQNILKYGAGALSYDSSGHQSTQYWNKQTYGLYIGDTGHSTNHSVTVVGWDDAFSKENFGSQKPGQDGAWLIKNSWGEAWGNGGYFWLSYYDKSLTSNNEIVQFFHITDMSPEEHLYQYDGTSNLASMNGKYIDKYANVFQAQGRETIKEISFYTMNPDVTYTAEIYINQSPDSSDPTGGKTPVFTTSGKIKEQGYHTVKLNTPVNVENGDYFSVVLQTKCASSDISIPIDSTVDYGWYSSKANAEKGQSFCMSYGRWYDINYSSDPTYVWNLRIKALTEDRDAGNIPASVPEKTFSNPETSSAAKSDDKTFSADTQKKTSGKIVFKKKIHFLKVKQKATVKAVITPAKEAHTTLVYTSSNPKYAKVNKKGKVTAKKAGKGKKVRITASAKDGSAKKASIVIKIK